MGWPAYVVEALTSLDYPPQMHDDVLRPFVARWGGVDLTSLARAVEHGEGEERALAMRMLAESRAPEAMPALRLVLQSPIRLDRWLAAQRLAEVGDPEVLPLLSELLFEGLPEPADYPATCIAPRPWTSR